MHHCDGKVEHSRAAAWQVERFAEHARARGRIRTPSYAQVSEGLSTAARGRFERYAACFGPRVRARLDPWVQRWGY